MSQGDTSGEDHSHVNVNVPDGVVRAGPVEDLGHEDNVNDHLEDGVAGVCCEIKPEGKVVEVSGLTDKVIGAKVVPELGEGSEDGQGDDQGEDILHEVCLKEANEDPAHEDRNEGHDLSDPPGHVVLDVVQVVEEHVHEDSSN